MSRISGPTSNRPCRSADQYLSGLADRDISESIISEGVSRPAITSATAAAMGISTLWRAASSWTDAHDLTPSATWRVAAAISATLRPRPSSSPNVRLRDNGEEQVATRSPRPARPENVCRSAPSAAPSRAI